MSQKFLTNIDFDSTGKAVNVVDPTDAQDVATKAYVDLVAAGARAVLNEAIVMSSSNLTLSGLQTIDGHVLLANERILLTGQSSASQNGVWVAKVSSWTRPTDFSAGSTQLGAAIFVVTGSTNGASSWLLTNSTAVTVDTTAQTWAQTGGSSEYSVTSPITKTGSTFGLTTVPVNLGGTNATTAAAARTSLGVPGIYATTFGDGAATQYTITHNLGTTDVIVQVYTVSSPSLVMTDVTVLTSNTVRITTTAAPASSSLRAVVMG